jgi:hypothetical protein
MTQPVASSAERHLAVDLHKHYLVIGGVNARQAVVLSPRRVALDEWPTWAKTNLKPTDVLVVEATTNRRRSVLRQAPRGVGRPPGLANGTVACAARPRHTRSGRWTARRDG